MSLLPPCRLAPVLVLASALLCASPAAATTTVDAGVLQVTSTPTGGLQAARDGRQVFSSYNNSAGLYVRFADGPLASRTYGPSWDAGEPWSAGTESFPMRAGETQTADTTYTAGSGTGAALRVRQTVRTTDHARSFRVTYRVENVSSAPVRFRAMAAGNVSGGTLRGVNDTAGDARAILPETTHGEQTGLEEVRSSRVAGDADAVPVPAWSARRSGDWWAIRTAIRSEEGPSTALETGTGTVAVWDDHQAADAGLAPGETVRYEVVWHARRLARLSVLAHPAQRWIGARTATDLRVTDQAGEPVEGARIRWTVTGAHPTSTPGAATTGSDGRVRIAYEGVRRGTDLITGWEDSDDDGVLDDGEPRRTVEVSWSDAPSPVVVDSVWQSPRIAESTTLTGMLYDHHEGAPLAGAPVLWSVAGPNDRPAAVRHASTNGRIGFSYTGTQPGTDTVRATLDRDDDGTADAGEPFAERTVTWRQAAPPPVTSRVLDGDGLDVTVSSTGQLGAAFDDAPDRALLRTYNTGVYARILDGPLAGKTFGSGGYEGGSLEPFHSDAQPAATRSGDVVTQESSWRVRSGGTDYLRIRQTARLTDASNALRLTWRIENLTRTPIRMRFGHAGDVVVDGSDSGTMVVGSAPAFVGVSGTSGFAAGLQEVSSSRLAGDAAAVAVPAWSGRAVAWNSTIQHALTWGDALGADVRESADAVAAQWSDRADTGLAAGAEGRYEILWRMRRPTGLTLTPTVDMAETRHEHRVTATLVDEAERPRPDVALRYEIRGQHPRSGEATTSATGQAAVAWTGTYAGRDVLTLYADVDADEVRDADEPQRTATVDWRRESAVDPPVFAPLRSPEGALVSINAQTTGAGFAIGLAPSNAALFPRCADNSPKVGLGLSVNVNPGLGAVVPGSMTLRTVSTATGDVEHPLASTAPTGPPAGERWSFVLDCLPSATFVLCYDLKEGDEPVARFCVTLGTAGVYDPSGIAYDRSRFDALRATGCPASAARRASAVSGARVILERKVAGEFRRVLSGDPFVTPNVNPFVTEAGGRFGWYVAAGTYRVVVSAEGFATTTSREAVVPPADVDLHVALAPTGTPAAPTAEMQAICDSAGTDPGPLPADELPAPDPPAPASEPQPAAQPDPAPSSDTWSQQSEPFIVTSPSMLPSGWLLAPLPTPRLALPRPTHKPAPRKAAAPARRLGVRAEGLRVDRDGRVRLRLVCPAGKAACAGKLVLVAVDGNAVLVRRGYRVAAGKKATLRVKLASTRRASARKRTIRVDVTQDGQRVTLGTVRVRR